MSEADWELFDNLCRQLHKQGRRISDLEERVESLLRVSASPERPALTLVEPTPVSEAWSQFSGDEAACPV